MSSRPIFITWAPSGTNYPAGGNPWNGNPVNVVPAYTYFTPDALLPAEYANYLIGSLANELTWLGTLQCRNLAVYEGSYNGTPENYAKPVYDSTHGWWLAGGPTGGNGFQISKDYGRSWALAAAAVDTTPRVHAIAVDVNGNWFTVGTGAIGNLRYSTSVNGGATWTKGDVDVAWNPVKKVHDLLQFLGTTWIAIGDDGTHTRLYTSTNFTVWTHISNPSGINTAVGDWHSAQSSTRWLAVNSTLAGIYATTTDGTSFSGGAMSGVPAGWTPRGVCFCNGLFYAIGDTGSGNSTIYSSADGTAWVLASSLIGGTTCNDIAANGTSLVVVENSTGQNPRVYFSVDFGATWNITPVQLASDTTPFMPVRVLFSDFQLGIANGTSLNLSLALG